MIKCEDCHNEITLSMHTICDNCFYTRVKSKEQIISFYINKAKDQEELLRILGMHGYRVWFTWNANTKPTINVIIED